MHDTKRPLIILNTNNFSSVSLDIETMYEKKSFRRKVLLRVLASMASTLILSAAVRAVLLSAFTEIRREIKSRLSSSWGNPRNGRRGEWNFTQKTGSVSARSLSARTTLRSKLFRNHARMAQHCITRKLSSENQKTLDDWRGMNMKIAADLSALCKSVA